MLEEAPGRRKSAERRHAGSAGPGGASVGKRLSPDAADPGKFKAPQDQTLGAMLSQMFELLREWYQKSSKSFYLDVETENRTHCPLTKTHFKSVVHDLPPGEGTRSIIVTPQPWATSLPDILSEHDVRVPGGARMPDRTTALYEGRVKKKTEGSCHGSGRSHLNTQET